MDDELGRRWMTKGCPAVRRGTPFASLGSVLLSLLRRHLAGTYDDVALALQLQLHGLAGAAADHRADRLRAVQRGVQMGGPADHRVRVHVHRLLRRAGDDQQVTLPDEPNAAVA